MSRRYGELPCPRAPFPEPRHCLGGHVFTVAEAALALDHRRTWARPPGAARCGSFCGSHQMRASRLRHDSTGQGGGTAPRGPRPRPVAVPRPWPLATTSLSCLHVCSRLDGLLVPFYCLIMSRRPDGPVCLSITCRRTSGCSHNIWGRRE